MTDGISKNIGNSRFMKIPANAKAMYPTLDALLDAMIAGTFAFDLNGINPDGWDVLGTLLTKPNLLSDETAAGLGLGAEATVNQAFGKVKSLITTAQNAANAAQSKADSAYSVASGIKIVGGVYTGDNQASRHIALDFAPMAVLLMARGCLTYNNTTIHGGLALPGNAPSLGSAISMQISGNGFTVYNSSNGYNNAVANSSDMYYTYLAVK